MMSTIAVHRRQPSVAASVTAIALGGAGITVLALAAAPHLPHPTDAPLWSSPVAVLAFVIATAVAEIVRVPLMHDGAVEDLTFFEIVTVTAMLLLAPSWALVAPLAGLAVAHLAMRKPVTKAAFNLGSYATATSAAVVSFLLVTDGASAFSLRGVLGLIVGMGVFAAINTVLLAVILHAAQGASMRAVITDFWALPVLMTFASISVGAVGVAVAPVAPVLVPFTLLPALALWYVYRSTAQQVAERARNVWLVSLSGQLAEERPLATLLSDAGEAVRNAFGAPLCQFVMPEHVAADSLASLCSDGPTSITTALLPEGWTSGVAVGLEFTDDRRGALLLGTDAVGRSRWTLLPQDAPLLTTVASSLSSAVRGIQHRDALVEESSKLKAVVEHTSDGIAVLDGTGAVEMWSSAMTRITGVTHADAIADGISPDALTALRALAVAHSGARSEATQLTITRTDGEARDVSVSVVKARPGQGRERMTILTVHDVTAQARADRLKSDFVATISHELRTPITPIKGYAQLLLARGDDMTPEKRTHALTLIAERADHLGRLVEDLLMASRASGTHAVPSKLSADPTPHDLCELVSQASQNFMALGERLALEQPFGAVPVFCDEVRTVQIVSNLISNAAKYSPEDEPILVRVLPSEFGDSMSRVEVIDRGQGISADDIERVFERFYRVEDSLTMRTSGSGLGLYIARELTNAMGGTLTVRSQPGQGSTFTLGLPRTHEGTGSTTVQRTPHGYARTA